MTVENPALTTFRSELRQKGVIDTEDAVALVTESCLIYERGSKNPEDEELLNTKINIVEFLGTEDTRTLLNEEVYVSYRWMPLKDKLRINARMQVAEERKLAAIELARQQSEAEKLRDERERLARSEAGQRRQQEDDKARIYRNLDANKRTHLEDRNVVRAKYPGINAAGMRVKLAKLRSGKKDW